MNWSLTRLPYFSLIAAAAFIPLPVPAASWNNYEAADLVVGHQSLPTPATLYSPTAVVVDSVSGKIFVADTGHNRILRFSSQAALGAGKPAEGVFGQADLYSDSPGVTESRLNSPNGLAMDAAGHLWVADQENNRVLRFDQAATATNGSPALQVIGQPDFVSHSQNRTQAGLNFPSAVGVDSSGRLWVNDYFNNRVLRYDNAAARGDGPNADGVLGQPDYVTNETGASAHNFEDPYDLVLDSQDRLWVADFGNSRVLRFDKPSAGNQLDANGVLGQLDFLSGDPRSGPGGLNRPVRLTASSDGRIFVADNGSQRVLRWDAAATLPDGSVANGVLGRTGLDENSEYSPDEGGFSESLGIFADSVGRLLISDYDRDRILIWNQVASKANGASADAVLGQSGLTAIFHLDAPAGITYPHQGLEAPGSGKFFVADQGRVLRFASRAALEAGQPPEAFLGQPSGFSVRGSVSDSVMQSTWGLALDSTGKLWVSDPEANRVVAFADAVNATTGSKMSTVLGQSDFSSREPKLTQSGMSGPHAIALDLAGNLYVADSENNRVLRFNQATLSSSGAPADAVLGQADFVTASNGADLALLKKPFGLVVDADGRLWVADTDRNRVNRYDQPLLAAPLEVPSVILGGIAATPNGMSRPMSLALESNRLWVMDTGFNRLLRFENAASKITDSPPDGVLGAQTLDEISNAGLGLRGFYRPEVIFTDAQNALWVADINNSRMMRFTPGTPTISSMGLNALGRWELGYEVESAANYVVQALNTQGVWEVRDSRTAPVTGRLTFEENADGMTRFYRVLSQ